MNSQELFQETVPPVCEVAPRKKSIRVVPITAEVTPEDENRQDDDIDLVVFRCRD
jgi:hypothetical protein